jgi:hypothetical protein
MASKRAFSYAAIMSTFRSTREYKITAVMLTATVLSEGHLDVVHIVENR